MLTGRPAFAGATLTDTLAAIVEREPDWIALPRATPAAVHRLLRRCLEKDSKLRLHDIADVRIEIVEALRPNPSERPTQHGRRPQRLTATAAVLVIAVLGTSLRCAQRTPADPCFVSRLTSQEAVSSVCLEAEVQISTIPDGQTVVFGATVVPRAVAAILDNTAAHYCAAPRTAGGRFGPLMGGPSRLAEESCDDSM